MSYTQLFNDVLKAESLAIEKASQNIKDEQVQNLINIYKSLEKSGGSLVLIGVGKSGIVAQKIASTFTSLGLSSYFIHPTEALHGDLGRINHNDAVCLISKSGSTEEIQKLLPYLPVEKESVIGLLGNISSSLASSCKVIFDCSVEKEACLNNQAPTTSSTLTLAMGDAMAVAYEKFIGLSKEGFAENHPGGILGKSLRMKVKSIMWKLEDCPVVNAHCKLKEILLAMTKNPVGGCAILDERGLLLGIIVEGDIRRALLEKENALESTAKSVMTKNPVVIAPDDLAFNALEKMEKREKQIDILPVVDSNNKFYGFIRLHDLMKEGFL
ncbi:MAG: KpsF/GutQ family sugar-phosphate isomerase [Halobacteriovoraceae bacterium]|nr:KpsF/GutQ family sugar-phosphate isomerase [Halobacteriovoraceae bacterium]